MVSRWNYIAITAVMAITFFLFQFTNVMLESWNNYEENSYVRDTEELPGKGDAYTAGTEEDVSGDRDMIVYIGDTEKATGRTVHTWADYTKKEILIYSTLEEYEASDWRESEVRPKMIVLDAQSIDWEKEIEYAEKYVASGIRLAFCNLPDVTVIRQNPGLQHLLGISEIKDEETEVVGIHLHEGFLLGGEAVYYTEDEEERARRQDMELVFPWYELSSGTEVYMEGICSGQSINQEEAPAVIWKNTIEGTDVFAVNGSYMEDASGLGILSAMSSEMNQYEIYPVVNAQNLVVANYPGLSRENEEVIMSRYGKSTEDLFRDTIWPSIIAIYRQNTLGLTCMLAPQFDYEDDNWPDAEQMVYYVKRLNEERAEMGLSGCNVSETPVQQKLERDQWFMEGVLPDYRFSSFYAGNLEQGEIETALQEKILSDVRTVVTQYDQKNDVIGYQTENITRQSILTDGVRHTYREDFRNRSVETALGYTSVLADLGKIVYPLDDEDALTELTSFLNWNIRNYFDGFRDFEGTTVSESDERIRDFLALDYAQHRENNSIYLELETAASSSWFVLRTQNETIGRVEGGNWKQLEKGVYLIEAQDKNVAITLKAGRVR